ncbi:hypothetical protein [Bacillus cereus]|uniref:hypothetical protein n=1 Tax=Bacillus cereus TaxID=1396 RepID=UPI0011A66771|nr:hypothetical protein [Bacillus cereus]
MPLVQYTQNTGVLHIGGARYFYANEPHKVTAKERDELLSSYSDLEEVKESKTSSKSQESE